MKTIVRFENLSSELQTAAAALLPELGIAEGKGGKTVTVTRGEGLSVVPTPTGAAITYGRITDFCRALSHLAGVLAGGEAVSEKARFTTLCLMNDYSRNGVMNMDAMKRTLRYLALMGYDSIMLYTEETYEVPEYPYFGHMRGRFSQKELKAIDDYAFSLGIEVIPCIQTLAHLASFLQWKETMKFRDTEDILLADNEETYRLIEAMLDSCKACFRSPRIHIGMDEAHMLGRGRFLDQHGYEKTSDILLRHLSRVMELCRARGRSPMMWSDMFFRMAYGGHYYIAEGGIPDDVAAKIPEGITLVYWDYYVSPLETLENMVREHCKLKQTQTAFAGGAWRWSGFAPLNTLSLEVTPPQLRACEKYGMTDVIVTAWGDDGSEASFYSNLPVQIYFAEYCYGGEPTEEKLEAAARRTFDIGFADLVTLDAPNKLAHSDKLSLNPCKYLLFNDPLIGLLDDHMDPDTVSADYEAAAARLVPYVDHPKFGYVYRTLYLLCRVLVKKADLGVRLRRAYLEGDKQTLIGIAAEIPGIVDDLDVFTDAFRTQWYIENKPFGFEVQEQRLGGLRARLVSTAERVRAYLAGEMDIPELAEDRLPFYKGSTPNGSDPYVNYNAWRRMFTASKI